MKPFVKVTLDLGFEDVTLRFTDTDNIDSLIEVLNMARADLEHRIEMKRIKNREKRKRMKKTEPNRKDEEDILREHYNQMMIAYNKLPDGIAKSAIKPYVDLVTELFEAGKK